MDTIENGTPFPLGAAKVAHGWNFAIYSNQPITEFVYAPLQDPDDRTTIKLHPDQNRSGSIWHLFVATQDSELLYAFKTNSHFLIDPYAKVVATGAKWRDNRLMRGDYSSAPLSVAQETDRFNWEQDRPPNHNVKDLIIYEMHVRGLTMHPSSLAHNPGSYLGVIEKIPYLKQLGINAVELLPIFEFDEGDCLNKQLSNYWGYQPLSFFSPMQRYSTSCDPLEALAECKTMIRELHKANIEVILDIVFNHTGEGNELGRTISWKGFSENEYYIKDAHGHFLNYSGCGNTLNCNHPIVSDMLIESLRYWVTEMHVDGFRFDLASILTRGQDGSVLDSSPLLDRITQDGILSRTKLIAEPWDAAGLHQVGHFFQTSWKGPEQWMEWNDDYRQVVRHFIKGSKGYAGRFATKLCGSQDLYGKDGSPLNSLNYITCHDGNSLRDLVTYQNKYNLENGEENRDGGNYHDSWNCGHEGPTADAHIEMLRQRQMRNFCVALMVSCGVPMIHMGDEYGHTKRGNNNTWCQDNELNWFLWHKLESAGSLVQFWKKMIHFRKEHPCLKRERFLTPEEITWHGVTPNMPDWSGDSHFVAYTIDDLYIAFNAFSETLHVTLPEPPEGKKWSLVVNTSNLSHQEFVDPEIHHILESCDFKMGPYSSCILKLYTPNS